MLLTQSSGISLPTCCSSQQQRLRPRMFPAFTSRPAPGSMSTTYQPPFGDTYPIQLASYTIDAQGNLISTNTWGNMPTPAVNVTTMNMSPSGKFLAVAGNTSRSFSVGPTAPPGVQVFHFNGASPITRYSGIITSAAIDRLAWDNSNHLFAISRASGKLYVYTVTGTSITAAPGSPYTLSNPSTLAVRPLL